MKRFIMLLRDQTLAEMLATRHVSVRKPVVYEADGRAVMLLSLSTPAPTQEMNDVYAYAPSGVGYSFLYSMILYRDAGWLQP